jgi:hypothetical protein
MILKLFNGSRYISPLTSELSSLIPLTGGFLFTQWTWVGGSNLVNQAAVYSSAPGTEPAVLRHLPVAIRERFDH